jgi:prepilin-type N-terminal cleavage/methylation domain-containing protein
MKNKGFTMIELLITLSLIAIISGIAVISLNPLGQFARARNTERWSNINSILNAIGQNKADNNGIFSCVAGLIPTATTVLGTSGYNIANCIAPTYIATLPIDPVTGTTTDSGYSIRRDAATDNITIRADDAELKASITVTR